MCEQVVIRYTNGSMTILELSPEGQRRRAVIG